MKRVFLFSVLALACLTGITSCIEDGGDELSDEEIASLGSVR
jgi:hypothetical protein